MRAFRTWSPILPRRPQPCQEGTWPAPLPMSLPGSWRGHGPMGRAPRRRRTPRPEYPGTQHPRTERSKAPARRPRSRTSLRARETPNGRPGNDGATSRLPPPRTLASTIGTIPPVRHEINSLPFSVAREPRPFTIGTVPTTKPSAIQRPGPPRGTGRRGDKGGPRVRDSWPHTSIIDDAVILPASSSADTMTVLPPIHAEIAPPDPRLTRTLQTFSMSKPPPLRRIQAPKEDRT